MPHLRTNIIWLTFFLVLVFWYQSNKTGFDYRAASYPVVKLHIDENNDNAKHGSGFLVSSDGYIVTCRHVVQTEEIRVIEENKDKTFWPFTKGKKKDKSLVLPEPKKVFIFKHKKPKISIKQVNFNVLVELYGVPEIRLPAKIVYTNKIFDIALLKIDIHNSHKLPYLRLSEKEPEIGQKVFMVSNPVQFSWSGYETQVINKVFLKNDVYEYILENQLPPGISGGPIFNKDREVVCMTNAIYLDPSDAHVNSNSCVPVKIITWMIQSLRLDLAR